MFYRRGRPSGDVRRLRMGHRTSEKNTHRMTNCGDRPMRLALDRPARRDIPHVGKAANERWVHQTSAPLMPLLTLCEALLHRHRFGQIAGLVGVFAHDDGRVIGEHLDRRGVDDRREIGAHVGHRAGNARSRPPPPRPHAVSPIRMMRPPRAATSCMFETVFSNTASRGAMTMTGIASSISAIGPCFNSPAA